MRACIKLGIMTMITFLVMSFCPTSSHAQQSHLQKAGELLTFKDVWKDAFSYSCDQPLVLVHRRKTHPLYTRIQAMHHNMHIKMNRFFVPWRPLKKKQCSDLHCPDCSVPIIRQKQ